MEAQNETIKHLLEAVLKPAAIYEPLITYWQDVAVHAMMARYSLEWNARTLG